MDKVEIKIQIEGVGEVRATLIKKLNPKTYQKIVEALPIEGRVNLWGDEIYFSTDLQINLEKTSSKVEKGDIAYWPPGKAICIFFGQTPLSRGDEIVPASPVNVVGKVRNNLEGLKKVKQGSKIVLEILRK